MCLILFNKKQGKLNEKQPGEINLNELSLNWFLQVCSNCFLPWICWTPFGIWKIINFPIVSLRSPERNSKVFLMTSVFLAKREDEHASRGTRRKTISFTWLLNMCPMVSDDKNPSANPCFMSLRAMSGQASLDLMGQS